MIRFLNYNQYFLLFAISSKFIECTVKNNKFYWYKYRQLPMFMSKHKKTIVDQDIWLL